MNERTLTQSTSPPTRTVAQISSGLLQRKCTCGGSSGLTGSCSECEKKKLLRQPLQTKSRINEPGDWYEREADRVAEQVMRRADSTGNADYSPLPTTPLVQRTEVKSDTGAGEIPAIVHDVLSSPGQPFDADTRAFTEQRGGHDFSRVQIHSHMTAGHVLPAQSMSIHRPGAISSPGGVREVFLNGPGDDPKPAPSSPAPVKRDQPRPVKADSKCPIDIQVADVGPATDVDFGKNGFLTGWGGISLMEVSDPSGKTWDGTAIHESLKSIKNTCGKRGENACSNKSGEQGGTAGSTFKVGEESNFLGKAKLPAVKNKFYDLHVFATKDASLLHELKKESCEVQCGQSFDCGGKRFGPDFIISYTMTRDVVKSGARNIDVTRVAMKKAAVVKQAAPGGEKP